ncbi:MAG: hybrid sensor histidine kinase/response regulator [Candidatus Parcubacteria bacterium]|nr:hybrid sensor histidine kinase/response regulator [Burkholderiales bacterium]
MADKASILIVDDRADKLLVLSSLLEPLEQAVVLAHSGEEALKHMLEQEFAVILMDVNMPTMDGLETASLIRKRRKTAHTPIIFITAYADEMHTARGYSLGAVDYILTPIVPDVLRTKVKVFVDLFLMGVQIRDQAAQSIALAHEQAARLAAEQTNQRLREADERKDQFLAMLSHELRNPMAAIRNAVEIMKIGPGDPDKARFARDVIDRQSAQLARLVDDLLDVSRITRGKIELRRDRFDLVQAVNVAVETNRSLVDARGHSVRLALPERPLTINGDFARTVQIVANLVHNACKYTADGGELSVAAAQEESFAVVRVTDSGMGIPQDRLADIFEAFVQLPHRPEDANAGLGVGLTLVKNLTELHGGSVEARSDGPGRGSEFVVRLPGLEQSGAQEAPASPLRAPTSGRGSAAVPPDQAA